MRAKINKPRQDTKKVFWTLERLLRLLSRIRELFASSHTEQKNALLRCIYANLYLNGKKLEIISKKPFLLLQEGLYDVKWSGTVCGLDAPIRPTY